MILTITNNDDAELVLHEFVGDHLDGEATQQDCINWVEALREVPLLVREAIAYCREHPRRLRQATMPGPYDGMHVS